MNTFWPTIRTSISIWHGKPSPTSLWKLERSKPIPTLSSPHRYSSTWCPDWVRNRVSQVIQYKSSYSIDIGVVFFYRLEVGKTSPITALPFLTCILICLGGKEVKLRACSPTLLHSSSPGSEPRRHQKHSHMVSLNLSFIQWSPLFHM
jgi:hypothetical protein